MRTNIVHILRLKIIFFIPHMKNKYLFQTESLILISTHARKRKIRTLGIDYSSVTIVSHGGSMNVHPPHTPPRGGGPAPPPPARPPPSPPPQFPGGGCAVRVKPVAGARVRGRKWPFDNSNVTFRASAAPRCANRRCSIVCSRFFCFRFGISAFRIEQSNCDGSIFLR